MDHCGSICAGPSRGVRFDPWGFHAGNVFNDPRAVDVRAEFNDVDAEPNDVRADPHDVHSHSDDVRAHSYDVDASAIGVGPQSIGIDERLGFPVQVSVRRRAIAYGVPTSVDSLSWSGVPAAGLSLPGVWLASPKLSGLRLSVSIRRWLLPRQLRIPIKNLE